MSQTASKTLWGWIGELVQNDMRDANVVRACGSPLLLLLLLRPGSPLGHSRQLNLRAKYEAKYLKQGHAMILLNLFLLGVI